LGEVWLVEIASRDDVKDAIGASVLAEATVAFQRLLTCSAGAAPRSAYDEAIRRALSDFGNKIVVPLKRARQGTLVVRQRSPNTQSTVPNDGVVFLAHSFDPADSIVTDAIRQTLSALGLTVTTGQRPKADSVSKKVRRRLDTASIFVGLFTRRERLGSTKGWSTSPWIIDEKAYALGKGKKLILLKEVGVSSIGGIQGDYEFIEFDRKSLLPTVIALVTVLTNIRTGRD
jgi:hypothetical protein